MRRILFVDDEQHILDGLRALFRHRREKWDMGFALGGEAALRELRARPCDIVVSDMGMAGMDGLTFLSQVQRELPGAVRIVLSGKADAEASIRAIPLVHQYLSKPIDGVALQDVLERSCRIKDLLSDEVLRRAIGQDSALPMQPKVYATLTQAIANPNTPIDKIADIIEQDMALSAEVLRLVNSAYFGNAHRMTNLRSAVRYLGTSMLKNLVLGVEAFRTFEPGPHLTDFSLAEEQRHALLTGRVAARLLPDQLQSEAALVAGVLHGVGKLILVARCAQDLAKAWSTAKSQGRPLHEVEQETQGFTHGEAGAYLLGLWGFPHEIVEAVAYHHAPVLANRGSRRSLDVLSALHIADLLANELAPGALPVSSPAPDLAYLEALGVTAELPGWRKIAASLLREQDAQSSGSGSAARLM